MAKHVAVVLCGSGRADGSEITEAVSVLIHLARHGVAVRCFALDEPQMHVVNHVTGDVTDETRNQMVEAARIARGEISPLQSLAVNAFAGVIFPGGFGAAKNLCDFAVKGKECSVHPEAARVITEFHAAGKPVGLVCIAPVLGAKVLGKKNGGPGVAVTVGKDAGVAEAIKAWGSSNIERSVTEAYEDVAHKVHSTPAYMYEASPFEVFTGIGAMVDGFVRGMGY